MFSPERAAQLCAEFARREGGSINVLKLVKLVYLCDRMSMDRYAAPITYDRYVSMDHGPVPSTTLDLVDGRRSPEWSAWMKEREGHRVSLRRRAFAIEDLDELSAADLRVVDETWEAFGSMDEQDLSRYTHEHCAEWQYPGGSSRPITEREIFSALGWSRKEAALGQQRIQDQRNLDRVFSNK